MPRRTWSLEEIKIVAERYPEEGPARLAEQFHRTEASVTSLARRFGLRSLHRRTRQARTRASNTAATRADFFDSPSPSVAYVLGFVFGCGSVKTHTRRVLRLRCPTSREPSLRKVLDLMGSKHILQRGRRRILVEIGDSRLVTSLLANCGRPPSCEDPDPPFPTIDLELLPHFALGLWDAAGEFRTKEIRCSGSPRLIEGLGHVIAASTDHAPATVSEANGRMAAVWEDVVASTAIRLWLASAGDMIGQSGENLNVRRIEVMQADGTSEKSLSDPFTRPLL